MNITLIKYLLDYIEKFLNIFGFTATFNFLSRGKEYETILPTATYAPWKVDKEFNDIYKKIIDYTYVDKYRCYDLWRLIDEIKKIPGALIEIGVWRGGTGAIISKKAELCGIQDTIYLCDTFEGIVKTNKLVDPFYYNGAHKDTSMKIVSDLIHKDLNLKKVQILKGIFPDESQKSIKENTFRFCHIDVDVYQSAKDIVEWIWDKMSIGGLIVFDDYGAEGCRGITQYVEEIRTNKDRLVFYNLNGHAIMIKIC